MRMGSLVYTMAMPRYVAFLRGVMPTNAKMTQLRRCFEAAGFTDVKTVLASGNVAFNAKGASLSSLERKAEASMQEHLGRSFYTIVRATSALRALLDSDPYVAFRVPPEAKRVVTFLRSPCKTKPALPVEAQGARVLAMRGCEIFTAYVRGPSTPVFMTLIHKTFGTDLTTRTWETIRKCAQA
jgi:uncharacterized protein (DUF1697 family)